MTGLILAQGGPCGILKFFFFFFFKLTFPSLPQALCIYVGHSALILTGSAVLVNNNL